MEKKLSASHVALEQFMSFKVQESVLAYNLLAYDSEEKLNVSLEVIGDVAVGGEEINNIEVKNYTSSNPLSDRADELWKTLYNFTKYYYLNGSELEKSRCILLVLTKKDFRLGISEKMKECDSKEKFEDLCEVIKSQLLMSENYKSKKLNDIAQSVRGKKYVYYAECLLSEEYIKVFEKVLYNFEIIVDNQSYTEKIANIIKLRYAGVDDNYIEIFKDIYIGMVSDCISKKYERNELIILDKSVIEEFYLTIQKIFFKREKFCLNGFLKVFDCDIDEQIIEEPIYIKQLQLLEYAKNSEEYINAAGDYLKLLKEKDYWIKNGYLDNVDDEDYIEYQKKQKNFWRNKKQFLELDGGDDIKLGKKLYLICKEGNHESLKGEILDPVLVRGMLQELANYPVKNELSIGWHPNYVDLLKEKNNE